MLTIRKQSLALYVERTSQRWCVRDADGNYWIVPNVEDSWDHRQPYQLTPETQLEAVPGHYKDMLGLPP
jgi:hypothetical protein